MLHEFLHCLGFAEKRWPNSRRQLKEIGSGSEKGKKQLLNVELKGIFSPREEHNLT